MGKPMGRLAGTMLFLAVIALSTTPASAVQRSPRSPWPQYGYGPRHDFFNRQETVLGPANVDQLVQQWSYAIDGQGIIVPMSTAAAVGRRVYVGSGNDDGKLYAFDAVTGDIVWTYSTVNRAVITDPAVWHGTVYAGSNDGNLYAWPTSCSATCTPTWAVPIGPTGKGTNSPPVISKGVLYIGGYDGRIYAFDATSGAELWHAQVNNPNFADPLNFAPAVAGGLVLVSADRGVMAFPTTCSTPCHSTWVAKTVVSPLQAPNVAGNTVYVADYNGTLYAIDASFGGRKWTGKVPNSARGAAVAGGVVYETTDQGQLFAFNAAGCGARVCDPLWTSADSVNAYFPPSVANGVVYVGYYIDNWTNGGVLGFPVDCPDQCQPIFDRIVTGGIATQPTVANGRLYATSVNGRVFAFGLPSH
jgi:outer membrane protein assembly factor BamB